MTALRAGAASYLLFVRWLTLAFVCLPNIQSAAAIETASNSTELTTPDTRLTKAELVSIICAPILGICTIMAVLSLSVWCRRRQKKVKSMKYFAEKFALHKSSTSGIEELPYERRRSIDLGYSRFEDEQIEAGDLPTHTTGADNPNYVESDLDNCETKTTSAPNRYNGPEIQLSSALVASKDVPVFSMKSLPDVSTLPPVSTIPSQELLKDSSIRQEVVEVLANQTSSSPTNQEEADTESYQVVYSQRTKL